MDPERQFAYFILFCMNLGTLMFLIASTIAQELFGWNLLLILVDFFFTRHVILWLKKTK